MYYWDFDTVNAGTFHRRGYWMISNRLGSLCKSQPVWCSRKKMELLVALSRVHMSYPYPATVLFFELTQPLWFDSLKSYSKMWRWGWTQPISCILVNVELLMVLLLNQKSKSLLAGIGMVGAAFLLRWIHSWQNHRFSAWVRCLRDTYFFYYHENVTGVSAGKFKYTLRRRPDDDLKYGPENQSVGNCY